MVERILSYMFLLGSMLYVLWANELSFGTLSSPKAGFLPIISGVCAVILAAVLVVNNRWAAKEKEENVYWRKFILIIAGLIFFMVCFAVAGFITSSFLIMLYLLKVMEMQGWVFPTFISAVVTFTFYGLFSGLLGISLP